MTSSAPHEPPLTPDVTDTQWNSIEKEDVLEYDAETETYRAAFDSSSESICTAVVSAVAAVTETYPLELPSLYSVIDADALEELVESSVTRPSSGDIHVTFLFNDCEVTVHTYGIIAVRPLQEESTD